MLWLALAVLAVLVLLRIGKLEKRLDRLERRLAGSGLDAEEVQRDELAEPAPPPWDIGVGRRPAAGEPPGAAAATTAVEPPADRDAFDEGASGFEGTPGAAPSTADGAPPPAPLAAGAPTDELHTLPPPPPPPPPAGTSIDWERWIGVQGAAVAGGIVLALAGVLLFKYSIEQGLISPAVRVIGGTLTGLACLVAVQMRWRLEYASTANALAGAGIVILYASFWAAKALYGFIGMPVAFVLMSLVTASCCLLAIRHDSRLIALLGLAGGFVTPLLLSSGSDRPLGLFGYVLVLDLAFLELARRQRWPLLAPISLAGTVVLQALWVGLRMGPDRLWIGLGVLAASALLYAIQGERARRADDAAGARHWATSQTGALLTPLAFTVYLASRAELSAHLWPMGLLLFLVSVAASWVASQRDDDRLAPMAAAGSVAVVTVWVLRQQLTTALAWETMGISLLLALVFQVFAEREPEGSLRQGAGQAAIVAAGVPFGVTIVAAVVSMRVAPAPWLVGWLALAALFVRHGTLPGRAVLHYAAAAGLGVGVGLLQIAHAGDGGFPAPSLVLAILVGVAVAGRAVAQWAQARPWAAQLDSASGILALLLLGSLLPSPLAHLARALPYLGAALLLGLVVLMAATSRGLGWGCLAATAVTALAELAWVARARTVTAEAGIALPMALLAVAVFTAWPLVAGRALREERPAWWASALAAPLWFPVVMRLWGERFGDGALGLPPLVLAALTLAAAARARELWPAGSARQVSALAWYLGVTLGFVSAAIPLQLEKEWITIGWALEGAALVALWRRLDHPGLKWLALGLLAAVTVRLVGNAALLEYHPRPSWRIVNWLLYTYLVPAAALIGAGSMLQPLELARLRPRERVLYLWEQPMGALACGLAALAVIFVWINLAIADWFATGPYVTLDFDRMPARDLTTSIAWALYALVLLAIGLVRRLSGLRWVSLGVLLVTIAKVFLYDLGELHDLYRVASLAGLAFSLILVSLAYQRFVFRKPPPEAG